MIARIRWGLGSFLLLVVMTLCGIFTIFTVLCSIASNLLEEWAEVVTYWRDGRKRPPAWERPNVWFDW